MVKASAMCYWRISDKRLMHDFLSVIIQVVLRRQQCHLFAITDVVLHTDMSSVATVKVYTFYGGINVTFMPLLFTPAVRETVSVET